MSFLLDSRKQFYIRLSFKRQKTRKIQTSFYIRLSFKQLKTILYLAFFETAENKKNTIIR